MGKRRKLQVHGDQGESLTQDERKLKEKVADKIDEKYKEKVAMIRATQGPRWRQICGVGPLDPYDQDNPYVHLEWFLCDFEWQVKLMNGQRDYVLQQMDDIQRQVYLHCEQPITNINGKQIGGGPYTDIESIRLRDAVSGAYRGLRKGFF